MFKYNSPIINEESLLNCAISNDDPIYQFCEECVDSYAYSGDEIFLEAIINEDLLHKAKRIIKQNRGKVAFGLGTLGQLANANYTFNKTMEADDEIDALGSFAAGGARSLGLTGVQLYGMGSGANYYIKKYKNRPKSVIAKKIAALRRIYSKWLQRANNAVEDREAGICKRIAAKIMNIIDGLLNLLQRKADGR